MAARAKKGLRDSDSDVFIPDDREGSLLALAVAARPPADPRRRRLAVYRRARGMELAPRPDAAAGIPPEGRRHPIYRTSPLGPPKLSPRTSFAKADFPRNLSLLDDRLVDQVAAAFQKDAWVERVVSVRKDFTRRLTVVLEYRKPVAFVVTETDHYPVDKNAMLLPPPSFPRGATICPSSATRIRRPRDRRERPGETAPSKGPRASRRSLALPGRSSSSNRSKSPRSPAPAEVRTKRFTSCGRSAARASFGAAPRQRSSRRTDVPAKNRQAGRLRDTQRRLQRRPRSLRDRHPPLARNHAPAPLRTPRPHAAVRLRANGLEKGISKRLSRRGKGTRLNQAWSGEHSEFTTNPNGQRKT